MEKTTKKRKGKKGLRKRIGIIAIGGMSVVLTVCLSVGATLAWFAGSTWASKSLYMGGPVYVEMAGRGLAGTTATPGTNDATWQGGDGNLDIEAAASRTTGTKELSSAFTDKGVSLNDILLPGQKVQIYSQARVFSTAETNTVADTPITNESSGANTTNTSNSNTGTATYRNESGRVTTTTTSVLRARFSIEVQFDPGMGFNNFTDQNYMSGYPVQSSTYTGDGNDSDTTWQGALEAEWGRTNSGTAISYTGRRDAVAQPTATTEVPDPAEWTDLQTAAACKEIRQGTKKSIYKWKYVSATEYANAADIGGTPNPYGVKMDAPFNGTPIDAADAPTGYYGVWVSEVVDPTAQTKTYKLSESDAFYKARCNAYLSTYTEFYVNEYGNQVTRTVADSVQALEQELNAQFVKLVNDSSDAIHQGYLGGFTVTEDGQMVGVTEAGAVGGTRPQGTGLPASWLYIDPKIGNDTNTDEISTSVGGWWYLVEDDKGTVGSTGKGGSVVTTVTDSIVTDKTKPTSGATNVDYNTANDPNTEVTGLENGFVRGQAQGGTGTVVGSADERRLYAKLYEVKPSQALTGTGATVTINDNGDAVNTNDDVVKMVSVAFPFVNGSFALPSDALSNLFANAKITFKIAFQALQAFFPYTTTIDKVDYTDAIMGTAKALNIKNAIPIFNEAFDYQEKTGSGVSGL